MERKSKKTVPKSSIAIDYPEHAFEKEELEEIERTLQSINYSLITHSHERKVMASFEELSAYISIFISSDIIQAICLGLATNGVYDTLKKTITLVYNKLRIKKFARIQSGKIDTNATPNVHIIFGQAHVILPMTLDDDKFKYFVDKLFNSIDSEIVTRKCYSRYDENTGEITYYSEEQVVRKYYSEWLQKQKNN